LDSNHKITTEALNIVLAAIVQQTEEQEYDRIEVGLNPGAAGQIVGLELANAHRAHKHMLLQRIVVSGLVPGSLAATCGKINVGDILIAVNGVSLLDLGTDDDEIEENVPLCSSAKSTSEYIHKHAPLYLDFVFLRHPDHPDLPADDVIICNDEQRTQIVAAAAKKMGLPYIPFRAVFVEGSILFWGDGLIGTPPAPVAMLPTWLSLGDYDNIFGTRNIFTMDAFDIEETDLSGCPIEDLLAKTDSAESALAVPDKKIRFFAEAEEGGEPHVSGGTEDGGVACARSQRESGYATSEVNFGLRVAPALTDGNINPFILHCLGSDKENRDDPYVLHPSLPQVELIALPAGTHFDPDKICSV
jgi:hypothetical protein